MWIQSDGITDQQESQLAWLQVGNARCDLIAIIEKVGAALPNGAIDNNGLSAIAEAICEGLFEDVDLRHAFDPTACVDTYDLASEALIRVAGRNAARGEAA